MNVRKDLAWFHLVDIRQSVNLFMHLPEIKLNIYSISYRLVKIQLSFYCWNPEKEDAQLQKNIANFGNSKNSDSIHILKLVSIDVRAKLEIFEFWVPNFSHYPSFLLFFFKVCFISIPLFSTTSHTRPIPPILRNELFIFPRCIYLLTFISAPELIKSFY